MIKKIGIGKAHGKIILGGEHSVVHGMPAVVLPLPIKVHAVSKIALEGLDVEILSKAFPKEGMKNHPELEGYVQMVLFIKKSLKCNLPIQVEVFSDIPIQSGLGSSAAVANAIAESVISLLHGGEMLDLKNTAVSLAEKFAHGNPSGLDAVGTHCHRPLLFQKRKPRPLISPLNIQGTFYFVVALSGIYVSTKQVVEHVSAYFSQNALNQKKMLANMSKIVEAMVSALEIGDALALGRWMTENHKALKLMGVSSTPLDEMVNVALAHGALGAKLSGKGIGGAVIALVKNKKEMVHLLNLYSQNGAKHVYPLVVNSKKRILDENEKLYSKSLYQHRFNQILGKEG